MTAIRSLNSVHSLPVYYKHSCSERCCHSVAKKYPFKNQSSCQFWQRFQCFRRTFQCFRRIVAWDLAQAAALGTTIPARHAGTPGCVLRNHKPVQYTLIQYWKSYKSKPKAVTWRVLKVGFHCLAVMRWSTTYEISSSLSKLRFESWIQLGCDTNLK